jgi:hypothetical protein
MGGHNGTESTVAWALVVMAAVAFMMWVSP